MLVVKFILLLFSVFIGYTLGWFFTEKWILAKWELFQFKAFECRPCLSFHIAWVTSTLFSLMFNDIIMLIIGVTFALIMFWGLNIDQKEKTISINDLIKNDKV